LRALQAQGVVGIAFNTAFHGLDFYKDIDPLLARLADLGMWAQFQVSGDQLVALLPRIFRVRVRTLIDHAGRPRMVDGPQAPGLRALAQLADSGLGVIKISGFVKFSEQGFPFDDVQAHVQRVWQMFGADHCIWASDWPYLRATSRLDYGPMLKLTERWFSPEQCQPMMWDNPKRFFDW
jgi:predicted TIM-barrel fold metal-dependent hydrolase